jgi:hypothetical protein
MIMFVKPGPSVPEHAVTSPVQRENPSAADVIEPSERPPNAGIPAAEIALMI